MFIYALCSAPWRGAYSYAVLSQSTTSYPHRSLVYPLVCMVRLRCERELCNLFMLRHTAESKLTSPNIKNLIQFKILYSSLNLKFYFTTHLIADPSSHSYSYIYSTSNETVKLSKHFSLREGSTNFFFVQPSLSVRNICCFTALYTRFLLIKKNNLFTTP